VITAGEYYVILEVEKPAFVNLYSEEDNSGL
jgi:hypothetical protein